MSDLQNLLLKFEIAEPYPAKIATETMGNAKYPLELLLRVITVSLQTNKIVNSLPKLIIEPCGRGREDLVGGIIFFSFPPHL